MWTFLLVLAAEAATPVGRGLGTGGATLGGAVVGGAVGGGLGFGLGVAACELSRSWECYLAPVGAVGGAGLGALGGAFGGGALGAKWTGARPRRVLGWSGGAAGLGLGLVVAGGLSGEEGLVYAGAGVGGLGIPLAAGLAAATDPEAGSMTVSVAPLYSVNGPGLVVRGSF